MLSGHQRITWRRNIAENFNRLSRVHERYRRQTDRQTDGRTTTYSEHEHEFTFAKNGPIVLANSAQVLAVLDFTCYLLKRVRGTVSVQSSVGKCS